MAGNPNDNSSDTATTTTTVDENTTTTTTKADTPKSDTSKTTSTTTVDAAAAGHVPGEAQGEVAIDGEARAATTNDNAQTHEDRLASAQSDAMRNHQAEHANDDDENRSSPAAV